MVSSITSIFGDNGRSKKEFPIMQINNAELARLIDDYIRFKLFNQDFDPMVDDNWRIFYSCQKKVLLIT